MTRPLNADALPSPIELVDSARQKYTLAQARIRRGPPELALLSLHGSLEDALRAHAIHHRLAAAAAPFPQLLDALVEEGPAPLSMAEAEGIRKMHRLRARVAHGEQINVAEETIDAYQRLAARLLPRYGVLVVGPEEREAPRTQAARPSGGRAERGQTQTNARALGPAPQRPTSRHLAEAEGAGREPRRRTTSTYPLLDRYPDLAGGRSREGRAASARALEEAERRASFFERSQAWLLPLIIILAIFLIGLTISLALQQMSAGPAAPPTAPVAVTFAPNITTAPPVSGQSLPASAEVGAAGPSAEAPTPAQPTQAPTAAPGGLAPGATAYVRADIPGLNLRAQPGVDQTIVLGLAPGTQVEVLEGPLDSGGLSWWRVRTAGVEGWCAGDLLEVR